MPLSCSCYLDDDAKWYWIKPNDYQRMLVLKRRKRCAECGCIIEPQSTVTRFDRVRFAINDVEALIFGYEFDAIKLAPYFLCEECSDLWFSLQDLGFTCVGPQEVRSCVREYAELYG